MVSLLVMMLVTAVAVAMLRRLFGAVMTLGAFSLLSAALFVAMDAVDVAFTEAAVGAGVSVILMLGTLSLTTTRQSAQPRTRARLTAMVVSLAAGGALMMVALDAPEFGSASAPASVHVSPRYIVHSPTEVGVPNLVTAVLASYRGYDTLGETAVVFTAMIGVIALLSRTGRRRGSGGATQDGER